MLELVVEAYRRNYEAGEQFVFPLLKWIIYPSMEKGVKHRWAQAFPVVAKNSALSSAVSRS